MPWRAASPTPTCGSGLGKGELPGAVRLTHAPVASLCTAGGSKADERSRQGRQPPADARRRRCRRHERLAHSRRGVLTPALRFLAARFAEKEEYIYRGGRDKFAKLPEAFKGIKQVRAVGG